MYVNYICFINVKDVSKNSLVLLPLVKIRDINYKNKIIRAELYDYIFGLIFLFLELCSWNSVNDKDVCKVTCTFTNDKDVDKLYLFLLMIKI